MFQTLSNVQRGEAIPLQRYIDNRDGRLRIGLSSITFTVGWYNVESKETFMWRNSGGGPTNTINIPPGLYSFTQLKDIIEGVHPVLPATLVVSKVNGLITLTVANGKEVLLSDGPLHLLGLDNGLGGVWLDTGIYTGDRPVDFATQKMLRVHLEEINTTENMADGVPTTLLACVGVTPHSFGDVHTVHFEQPKYKRLTNDSVGELKITIRDRAGELIDNHHLPIDVSLVVVKSAVNFYSEE